METLIELWQMLPYGQEIMVGLATGTAGMTLLTPTIKAIAKITPWTWDDKLLENPIMKKVLWIGTQLKRFSLI